MVHKQWHTSLILSALLISSVQVLSVPESDNPALEGLEPKEVFYYFGQVSKIPRPSHHEHRIAEYIVAVAHEFGFDAEIMPAAKNGECGNVIVRKPATPGKETKPTVVLQAHMDMVTEKNSEITHDFFTEGIEFVRSGNKLLANGTTLGADNGIGCAAMLAVMASNDIAHGPLEFLFTSNEEDGFDGADSVLPEHLKGRLYINLDAEEDGSIYVGCAGGMNTIASMPLQTRPIVGDLTEYTLKVSGLQGGHSGVNIHENRINAIKILTDLLLKVNACNGRLVTVSAGDKLNAICREATATVILDTQDVDDFELELNALIWQITQEFAGNEPKLDISFKKVESAMATIVKHECFMALINALRLFPHGVYAWSKELDNVVETSANLARVRIEDGFIKIGTSQRSMVRQQLTGHVARISGLFESIGFAAHTEGKYSPWQPKFDSEILSFARVVYARLFNKKIEVKAIHAGLECASIDQRIPDMQMISYGPTITGAHSPDETLHCETVPAFWQYTVALLEAIAA